LSQPAPTPAPRLDRRLRWILAGVAAAIVALTAVVIFRSSGDDTSTGTTRVGGEPGQTFNYTILDSSMAPTIPSGSDVSATTLSDTGKRQLRRGDIVVLQPSDLWKARGAKGTFAVARVVGLPGDILTFTQGRVLIDGDLLDEPYTHGVPTAGPNADIDADGDGTIVVPVGELFLLGDNRRGSLDSRALGPLPIERVVARVLQE
jgi:signal peptidase I